MSKPNAEPRPDAESDKQIETLFAQAESLLGKAVRVAFMKCQYWPSPEDVERLKQRLRFHLLTGDYRRLRTYSGQSELKTWLQQVVNREVGRHLKQESRKAPLDDAPAELFTQPPTQETLLLEKEQWHLIEKALPNLTARQRKIFDDWRQGVPAEQTARAMEVKVGTVHRQRQYVLEKIRKLIQEGEK